MEISEFERANATGELSDEVIRIQCQDCGQRILFDTEDQTMITGSCECGYEYAVKLLLVVYKRKEQSNGDD